MKRAICLSSGSSKGSYQAGCLKHLLGDLNINYDIICGTSSGAINGAFISMFNQNEGQLASKSLCELWGNLSTKHIYKRWFPFGIFHSLWQPSFFDSSPMMNLIKNNISLDKIRKSGKNVYISAVSLDSGKSHIFDQSDDDFINVVCASASMPGLFLPIKFKDQLWSDGASKQNLLLKKAIELGADIIDLVITTPKIRIKKFTKNPKTVDVLKRSIDLSTDKILTYELEIIETYNEMAKLGWEGKREVKLNIIRPEFNLTDDVMDFDPVKIRKMIEKGYKDAQTIIL